MRASRTIRRASCWWPGWPPWSGSSSLLGWDVAVPARSHAPRLMIAAIVGWAGAPLVGLTHARIVLWYVAPARTHPWTRAGTGPGGCNGALLVPRGQPHEYMGQPFRLSGVHLSQLLRLPILTSAGETVGPLEDVVVRLRAGGYPLVIGPGHAGGVRSAVRRRGSARPAGRAKCGAGY